MSSIVIFRSLNNIFYFRKGEDLTADTANFCPLPILRFYQFVLLVFDQFLEGIHVYAYNEYAYVVFLLNI